MCIRNALEIFALNTIAYQTNYDNEWSFYDSETYGHFKMKSPVYYNIFKRNHCEQ